VALDAELVIRPFTATPQQAPLRARLAAFLDAAGPGGRISFDALAAALRDEDAFALDRAATVLVLDLGAAGFTELRDGDPELTLPAGARAVLREFTLREAP
jgi:hypothetical protein